jgi:hypothetical protein
VAGVTDEREAEGFFLDFPENLNGPFPGLAYLRENRTVFFGESRDIVWYRNAAKRGPDALPLVAFPSSRRSSRYFAF